MPAALPGLHVDGVGDINLPLSASQAKAISRKCEQAPFGRREATIIDTSVRNAWQMDPSKFTLRNPGKRTASPRITSYECNTSPQ